MYKCASETNYFYVEVLVRDIINLPQKVVSNDDVFHADMLLSPSINRAINHGSRLKGKMRWPLF